MTMLELRPNCECCDKDLPPESTEARICTFECVLRELCGHGVARHLPELRWRTVAASASAGRQADRQPGVDHTHSSSRRMPATPVIVRSCGQPEILPKIEKCRRSSMLSQQPRASCIAPVSGLRPVLQRQMLAFRRLFIAQPLLIVVERGEKAVRWDGGECLIRAGEAVAIAGGQALDIENRPDGATYRAFWLAWMQRCWPATRRHKRWLGNSAGLHRCADCRPDLSSRQRR
jgi:hypothetical protein